ncbi:MAG TPA: YidB family protein [Acidobacteriaceae bacterium]|jgi:uncharacterized protein YidB (DUF937 family)|nr:YidB family protein [Acidobacteriaceae bacterium]
MGLLDEIGNLTGATSGESAAANPQVANGVVQALQEHPGGIGSVLDALRQNGMSQHVDAWTQGQQQPANPQQVQQALGPSGFIDRVAEKAGISPQVATMAMTALLPVIIRHFAPGGQPAPQSQIGSLASGLLSKLL